MPIWFKKFERAIIILGGSSFLTLVLLSFDFHLLEANLYDLRMRRGTQRPKDPKIVLISLDDRTTRELEEMTPFSLDIHAEFIEQLERMKPRAVGYLVDLHHVAQVNPQLLHEEWGLRFVQAAKRMIRRGTPVLLGTPFDVSGEILPPFPLSSLPHSIAIVHKDGNVFSGDKVTRRALLWLHNQSSFHLRLARSLQLIGPDDFPPGKFEVPEVQGSYFFFRYHGNTAFHLKDTSDPGYTRFSFVDILEHRVDPRHLKDKIVLVGTLSSDDPMDFALTPYSREPFTQPKLMIHATILDSILHEQGITRIPDSMNALCTLLVTTAVLGWTLISAPMMGVLATLCLCLGFILFSQAAFQTYGLWIRESQPLIGIVAGYFLMVPYRLFREYKTRWDYQRQSELLIQVEQLKTNFISLVTHDLKTPVARIHGLAESLLRKTRVHLSPGDQERLRHIIVSADELNHFITSILELSRIESNHLSLHFESKDVNLLIEKAVEEFRPQARTRGIHMNCQLEPLFPIKIDVASISKVLKNVIDNAVKYSRAGSRIQIESKEENDFVVISVIDQGIGMTKEEQKNLFTRFYRAKNDATTQIGGTGLGLYLTKYFIESHQGRVEVFSQKNRGSTFRIYLPLHQDFPNSKRDELLPKIETNTFLKPPEGHYAQSTRR